MPMRRVLLAALVLASTAMGLPVGAMPLQSPGHVLTAPYTLPGTSPNVLPGGSQPSTNPALNTYNTITPAFHGSPSDYGYNFRGWARWNDIPLVEVGQTHVAGSRQIGLLAAHPPTNAELAAGMANNVASVDVRCDGGSYFAITAPSVNHSASGVTDWNFTVNSANFADGLHKCDAVIHPTTGPDVVMEGPLEDANHNAVAKNTAITVSGHTLTVSGTMQNAMGSSNGKVALALGMSVSAKGIGPNSRIDGDSTTNATSCVPDTGSTCTGSGENGTYHLTGASQTVPSAPAVFNIARSFYFITDFHGSLNRGTHIIYASLTGNDSNTGADAAHPVAGTAHARGLIYANDSTNHGAWGGIVCLMNSGTWASDSGAGSEPTATLGFIKYQSAGSAECPHSGDPGGATLTFSSVGDRTWGGLRVWYKNMKSVGGPGCRQVCYPDTQNGGLATQLVAENLTNTGQALGSGGVLGTGVYACVDSTAYFGTDGGCNRAQLARNNTFKYFNTDGFHGVSMAVSNILDGQGPILFWTTGSSTAGSNQITGVTVPDGFTLAQLFPAGSQINVWDGTNVPGYCFSTSPRTETVVSSTNDSNHTIVTNTNALSTCASSHLGNPGTHADGIQEQGSPPWLDADIIYVRNNFGAIYPGFQQGLFLEGGAIISGALIAENIFQSNSTDTNSSALNVNGGNDHFIYVANSWAGGALRQDVGSDSNDETFVDEVCPRGGRFTGAGTNIRRKAAASQRCHTTAP